VDETQYIFHSLLRCTDINHFIGLDTSIGRQLNDSTRRMTAFFFVRVTKKMPRSQ
jgi:hypothetical protein